MSSLFSLSPLARAIKTLVLSSTILAAQSYADQAPVPEPKNEKITPIEVITITHQRHQDLLSNESYASGRTSEPDLANWLTSVPGANINSNGPVTGIAQYRGLYGDRVAATLNGHAIIGAGPNAMDTPLSYSTPLIVDAMTVYRGIAPVSAAIDTLGGAIDVQMRQAETSQGDNLQTTGDLQAGYRSNNSAGTVSSVVNFSKNDLGILLYGNVQSGDDMESGDNDKIKPTEFEKRQFGTDIRYASGNSEVGLSYHYTDTQDSGTPALPMDIEYIFSHRVSLDGNFMIGDWQADWLVGHIDADHGMTNFEMRTNTDPTKYRRNNADATTTDFKFVVSQSFDFGDISLGLDGYFAKHNSVITNPNNGMFRVVNFRDVRDERYGLFVEWQQQIDRSTLQLGARVKHSKADANEVYTSMAMMSMPDMDMGSDMDMDTGMGMGSDMDMDSGMDMGSDMDMDSGMDMNSGMGMDMAAMASELQDKFNNADRSQSDTTYDIAMSIETQWQDDFSTYAGLGMKNRAPSYQERYLWTPMEATGGLADGHTYIGDINLDSETAYQADLGLTYDNGSVMIAPHIFYQKIDDYIQGTPLGMQDMTARMMASMMAGDDNPLKFTNVDAKLYGMDVNGYYKLSSNLQLTALISYVKGERRDVDDNLYRIAPLNGQVSLYYSSQDWIAGLSLVAAAKQDDVSETNQEQETSGYGVINLDVEYFVNNAFTIRGGVDNILDKEYRNHLGGYNRVKDSDITHMSRLPSEGVSAWVDLSYSF